MAFESTSEKKGKKSQHNKTRQPVFHENPNTRSLFQNHPTTGQSQIESRPFANQQVPTSLSILHIRQLTSEANNKGREGQGGRGGAKLWTQHKPHEVTQWRCCSPQPFIYPPPAPPNLALKQLLRHDAHLAHSNNNIPKKWKLNKTMLFFLLFFLSGIIVVVVMSGADGCLLSMQKHETGI